MRPSYRLALAAIISCSIGCGGGEPVESPEEDPVSQNGGVNVSEPVDAGPTLQSSHGEPTQSDTAEVSRKPVTMPEPNATPQQVVHAFLEATRGGDKQIASELLTRKAVEETTKRGLSVQPPGSASMHYVIGRSEPAPNNKVYVNSVWSEQYDDGSKEEYEVVWILRQENVGWRITGMAAQFDEQADPLFIDFEFPEELAKRVGGGESTEGVVGVRPEPRHQQATRPGPRTTPRANQIPGTNKNPGTNQPPETYRGPANGQPSNGGPAYNPRRRF